MFYVFLADASHDKLVIELFDRKIEIPSDCIKNLKRSSEESIHYFCAGEEAVSGFAELIVSEYASVSYKELISDAEEELGLKGNMYKLNEFEVFDLSKSDDESANNILTSICNATFCISIFGNYQNVVADVKRQLR